MDPNDIWAGPPIATKGEERAAILHQAVGEALSDWEHLEGIMAFVFSTMLGENVMAAQRAYGSIAAFTGRLDLLKGAASGYFEHHPDDEQEEKVTQLLATLKRASVRRNEIAHGTVTLYPRNAPAFATIGYLLMPASYSVAKNDEFWEPKYAYDADTVSRFGRQFNGLVNPAAELLADLTGLHQAQRAGRIPPSTPKPGSLLSRRARPRSAPPSPE